MDEQLVHDLDGVARDVDAALRRCTGERPAFFLAIWTDGWVRFVFKFSQRTDAIQALEETLTRLKEGMPDAQVYEAQP